MFLYLRKSQRTRRFSPFSCRKFALIFGQKKKKTMAEKSSFRNSVIYKVSFTQNYQVMNVCMKLSFRALIEFCYVFFWIYIHFTFIEPSHKQIQKVLFRITESSINETENAKRLKFKNYFPLFLLFVRHFKVL